MADVAPNFEERQEFWKPVVAPRPSLKQNNAADDAVCRQCGADLVIGSRFCHICGMERHNSFAASTQHLSRWFDFASFRDALGQTTSSLVAMILGLACVIAALVTGFIYTAATVLDWQAVQIWRVEWLLAAIALFLAGILVKKK